MTFEHSDVLDVMYAQFQSDQAFYSVLRFVDGRTRSDILAFHQRNNHLVLAILRAAMNREQFTVSIPITLPTNWSEPVTVAPTSQQISNATERAENLDNTMCTVCQETVANGLRLRHCRHCFHNDCITEWFTRSVHCPVCRADIREASTSTS